MQVHARLSVPTIHFESTILYSIGNYNYYSILIDLVIVIIKTIIHYYYFTISALYSMFEYTIIISYYAPSSTVVVRARPRTRWLLPRRGECARPTTQPRPHNAHTVLVLLLRVGEPVRSLLLTSFIIYARTPRTLFGVCAHTRNAR